MTTRPCDITGIGAVTGYGWGTAPLWNGLRSGTSAACPQPDLDAGAHGDVWACAVADGGDPADGRGRFQRAMRAAAREAIQDARTRGWRPRGTVGLLHAVVLGEVDLWKEFYLANDGHLPVRDYLSLMPSTPVSTLMQEFDFHGPAMNVGAMCASGNAGLLTAKAWLDAGLVDDVLFIASDLSITPAK